MVSYLNKIDGALLALERLISLLSLAIIVLVTALAVVFRYLIDSPLSWTADAGVMAMICLTFFGASAVFREGGHVAASGLVKRLPPRIVTLVGTVLAIVLGASVILIGVVTIDTMRFQMDQDIIGLGISRAFYSVPVVWAAFSITFNLIVAVFNADAGRLGGIRGREG